MSPSHNRSFSSASFRAWSSFDEQSEADIEKARSWIAAQWRLSGVSVLKLKESTPIDAQRWRTCGFHSIPAMGEGGSSLNRIEKLPLSSGTDDDVGGVLKPVQFPVQRKVCICISIILMTTISLLTYTVICGVTSAIAADFGVTNSMLQDLYGSIYLFGVGVGGFIWAPLSERYGRLPIYHTSNVGFIIAVLVCSKCNDSAALLVLRLASGLCGCSSLVLGGPTIRDMVYAEEQCHSRVLWSICRLCPLFGYVAAQYGTFGGRSLVGVLGWRDVFRCLGIGAIVVAAASAVLLRETYAPVLQSTASQDPTWAIKNRTVSRDSYNSQSSCTPLLRSNFSRRTHDFSALSPTVLLLSIYSTISNCYIYLLYPTLSEVFEDKYKFSASGINQAYIGLGSGMAIGVVFLLFVYPHFALSTRGSQDLESLLWMTVPAAVLMPTALFIYGWSIHLGLNSVIPVAATGMMGAAFLTTFVPIQIYLIDLFTTKAASALAPSVFLSNVGGSSLPFVARHMLNGLGIAWASSFLGCMALLMLPCPFLFLRWGRSMREGLPRDIQ